jgi:diguanylate cyclase
MNGRWTWSPTPLLGALDRRFARVLQTLLVLLVAGVAVHVAYAGFGVGRGWADDLITKWLLNLVLVGAVVVCAARAVAVAADRWAWVAIAGGMLLWTVANAGWTIAYGDVAEPPFPSVADALWLAWYPAVYAGLVLLVRRRVRAFYASVWLDGLIGGLTVAAFGVVLVVAPVAHSATGTAAAVIVNVAYPLGDLLLASFVVGVFALSGWRPSRDWVAIGAALVVLAVADAVYVVRVATGSYVIGTLLDSLWPLGMVVLAFAAWQPPAPRDRLLRLEGWPVLVMPFVFMAASLGLLVAGGVHGASPLGSVVAGLALAAGLGRMALTFRDVRALADSRRQALTDELTGLPNRRSFYQRAEQMIVGARDGGERLGVLLIDLDRFKEINDTLGHHAGDVLLEHVGPRLRGVLRDGDLLARLGGDEFTLVVEAELAEGLARRIADALRQPFQVQDINVHIGASVGIAFCPDHGGDAQTLLQRADVAMYEAKLSHRAHAVYDASRDRHTVDRLALIGDLHEAIARDELCLHYQPKSDIRTGAIVGVEALVRWQHPERGLIPPAEFLPLAEQTGAMRALTDWVLREALRQCAQWRAAGRELTVAVNVSATNVLDDHFADAVIALLHDAGLPPRLLVLEITEDVVMTDPVRAREVLGLLNGHGVGIALDDFGTGYSSLAYLKQLTVDELKIDRSFVQHIARDRDDAAIVRSTVSLAHSLKLRVVGEGVEDADALAQLADFGAEIAQGYYLSRPLPAPDLARWLDQRARDDASASLAAALPPAVRGAPVQPSA